MSGGLNVYPDGMPHPSPRVRRNVALELLVLLTLTSLYVTFMPADRAMAIDMGMALVGIGLVGILARESCKRLWGPPSSPDFERFRRSSGLMVISTAPVLAVLAAFGIFLAYNSTEPHAWSNVFHRFFRWHIPLAFLLYVFWAMMQQTLFQFYLLGRLRALLPFASPLTLSIINGVLYGCVHLPDPALTILTMIGGVVWSFSYHRDRFVVPIALSHAIAGTAYFYWVKDSDIIDKLLKSFAN